MVIKDGDADVLGDERWLACCSIARARQSLRSSVHLITRFRELFMNHSADTPSNEISIGKMIRILLCL